MVLGRLGELGLDGCGLCLQARYIVSRPFQKVSRVVFFSVFGSSLESVRAGGRWGERLKGSGLMATRCDEPSLQSLRRSCTRYTNHRADCFVYSIQTWALEEAQRRLQIEGILPDTHPGQGPQVPK